MKIGKLIDLLYAIKLKHGENIDVYMDDDDKSLGDCKPLTPDMVTYEPKYTTVHIGNNSNAN